MTDEASPEESVVAEAEEAPADEAPSRRPRGGAEEPAEEADSDDESKDA